MKKQISFWMVSFLSNLKQKFYELKIILGVCVCMLLMCTWIHVRKLTGRLWISLDLACWMVKGLLLWFSNEKSCFFRSKIKRADPKPFNTQNPKPKLRHSNQPDVSKGSDNLIDNEPKNKLNVHLTNIPVYIQMGSFY